MEHSRTRPLSRSLESQIRALCARPAPYAIEPVPMESGAPDTLSSLLEQSHALGAWRDSAGALQGSRIPVWSGKSARTIWSTPEANWLFRAWHDSHHILLGAEFDSTGELRVARHACAQISGKPERAILWAELWGQVCYYNAHGAFPENQRAFVRDCIVRGLAPTVASGLYHREQV